MPINKLIKRAVKSTAVGLCLGLVTLAQGVSLAESDLNLDSGSENQWDRLPPDWGGRPTFDYGALEAAVLLETNRVRLNPQGYAEELMALRQYYRGRRYRPPGQGFALLTKEGVRALDDAIEDLQGREPVGTLRRVAGMDLAAADLAREQAQTGAVGHRARDGSRVGERLNRYGRWRRVAGENNYYGAFTGVDMVRQLIIDDGVANRGHRVALFNPRFEVTGIACGPHPRFRVMCSINYAARYVD